MKVRVVNLRWALTPALSRFAGEGVIPAPIAQSLIAVLLATSLFIPKTLLAAEVTNLTVLSYPDRPAKLPLWLAQEAGLFQKYGLKVEIKTPKGGEDLVERIGRDEAQIYAATANWIVSGIGDGKDLVFFANTGYSVLKLLSRPSITRPSELKGKRDRHRRSQQQPGPDHAPGAAASRAQSRQGCHVGADGPAQHHALERARQRRDRRDHEQRRQYFRSGAARRDRQSARACRQREPETFHRRRRRLRDRREACC